MEQRVNQRSELCNNNMRVATNKSCFINTNFEYAQWVANQSVLNGKKVKIYDCLRFGNQHNATWTKHYDY